MNATEFANACYQEKEQQLRQYMNGTETAVGVLREQLNLSEEQQEILGRLLDTALTDTYITFLYSLDGESSLGHSTQQIFKLFSEDGMLISDGGDLEAVAYEAFFEAK